MIDLSYEKLCNAERLYTEIQAGGLSGILLGVSTSGATTLVHVADEVTQAQQDALQVLVNAHTNTPLAPFEPYHEEEVFTSNLLTARKWYADAVCTILVKQLAYTYEANKLVSETLTRYKRDGSVLETQTWTYSTETTGRGNNQVKKNRKVLNVV